MVGVMVVSLWGCTMEGLYTKKGPPLEGKVIGILPFGTTADLAYTGDGCYRRGLCQEYEENPVAAQDRNPG